VIDQALILAGGKGSRLDPLGDYLPKCLATVYNRPLIDRQLELLQRAGVRRVFISVSAVHHDVVEQSLQCLQRDLVVELIEEKRPAGVAALFEAAARMPATPFWFVLGDLYYGAESFAPASCPERCAAVLHARQYQDPVILAAETSNIVVKEQGVSAVLDKPLPEQVVGQLGWYGTALIAPSLISCGRQILDWLGANRQNAHVGDLFEGALRCGLEIDVIQAPEGAWINVNTPDQLLQASLSEQRRQQDLSRVLSA